MEKKADALSREEERQAYTDAIGALAVAMSWQLDPIRLYADLKALANHAAKQGHGPSAGLIDHLARRIEAHSLTPRQPRKH